MSSSFFVNIFLSIYKSIENSYENSLTFKVVNKIFIYAKHSVIIRFFNNYLTKEKSDIKNKSVILNFFDNLLAILNNLFSNIYNYFYKMKDSSFVVFIFQTFLEQTRNLGKLANSFGYLGLSFSISFLFLYGFSFKVLLISIATLIGSLILILTNFENLDESIKKSLLYKLIIWFFEC